MTDLRKEVDDLASHVAKQATKAKNLQESIDALDVLTKYYAVTLKKKGKGDDADDDDSNFGAFSDQINGAENEHGRKPSSGRRRVS